MTAKRPTPAQARALRIAAADVAGYLPPAAPRTVAVLTREGWAAEEAGRLTITNDGRRAIGAAVPVTCEACEDAGTGCYYCAPPAAAEAETVQTWPAPFAEGQTVEVTDGFAQHMTGPILAVEYGRVLGWTALVDLPGYGPRRLPSDFLTLAAA